MKLKIKDGSNSAFVDITHNSREVVVLNPFNAVKLGRALIERAQAICSHERTDSTSGGPFTNCKDCGRQVA